MKADLLDCIGNVRVGECQVLKGAREATICSGVSHRGASCSGHLGTSVNRSGAWVTAAHAMTFKNVEGVLPLGEDEGVLMVLYRHAEEVVQQPKVFHGKLLLQGSDHTE